MIRSCDSADLQTWSCILIAIACSFGAVLQTWSTILIAIACSFGAALQTWSTILIAIACSFGVALQTLEQLWRVLLTLEQLWRVLLTDWKEKGCSACSNHVASMKWSLCLEMRVVILQIVCRNCSMQHELQIVCRK